MRRLRRVPVPGLLHGEVTPAIVLRAAAQRLKDFPIHRGADVCAAIAAAAENFITATGLDGALDADDLREGARTALAEYIDYCSGPSATVPSVTVIDSLGQTVPRSWIASVFYSAAAHSDNMDYDFEDGEFDSYDG